MKPLGRITIPAGASRNNTTTVAPFVIPPTTDGLVLVGSAAGLHYRSARDAALPSALAATATDLELWNGDGLPDGMEPAVFAGAPPFVVAVWNTTGGAQTVDVFAGKMFSI